MDDLDTFLTTMYVLIDDLCKALPRPTRPGPAPALSDSEAVCLALLSQWGRFGSERGFWRFAQARLRFAFPRLPARTQFNRQVRRLRGLLTEVALRLAEQLQEPTDLWECLDATCVPTRNAKRRGSGWLPGQAALGKSAKLGWFCGVKVMACCTPRGALTGWVCAPGNVNDSRLADDFLAARAVRPKGVESVGQPRTGTYLGDRAFDGQQVWEHWRDDWEAIMICPGQKQVNATGPCGKSREWNPEAYRQQAGWRQIIETAFDKLHDMFRLSRERPHCLEGVLSRLAAKIAAHNFAMVLNRSLGRPLLAFADLLPW